MGWLTDEYAKAPELAPPVRPIPCRFGCQDGSIGLFYFQAGCACYPDPIQALCAYHANKCTPLGEEGVYLMARWAATPPFRADDAKA